jgi:hypothetical protein
MALVKTDKGRHSKVHEIFSHANCISRGFNGAEIWGVGTYKVDRISPKRTGPNLDIFFTSMWLFPEGGLDLTVP